MLAAWRASWFGWLPPVLYAAIVPVLLYIFLHFAVARAEELLRGAPRTVEGEVQALRMDVRSVADAILELADSQRKMLALPEQASYPRPEGVADVALRTRQTGDSWTCTQCGTTATTGQRGAAGRHGHWRCKGCGARQERQNHHTATNPPVSDAVTAPHLTVDQP